MKDEVDHLSSGAATHARDAVHLDPGLLKRRAQVSVFDFETTEELSPTTSIIGQPRALAALELGLEMADPSYNVFVAGPAGSGRTTAVEAFLGELATERPAPADWCYVNNFSDVTRPLTLRLGPGEGRRFAADVDHLVERARNDVPRAFESDEYTARRRAVQKGAEREREKLFEDLRGAADQTDFVVETGPLGVLLTPVVDGQPITDETMRSLTPEDRQALAHKSEAMQEQVKATLRKVRDVERRAQQQLDALNQRVVEFLVGGLVDDLVDAYSESEDVVAYLRELRDAVTSDGDLFLRSEDSESGSALAEQMLDLELRSYRVNVMIHRDDPQGAPVVIELNPTYANLFGVIEKESRFGALHTDFTLLRPGALHQANGGYLVLPARELLLNYMAYDSLKRALRNRQIDIEEPAERLGLTTTRTLRPEPIPLEVKVVLIGTPLLYHLLYMLDEDFTELFKVKAHFDDQMVRTDEVDDYAAFVSTLCHKEQLPPLDRSAVALIVEHGSRLAEDQTKLSTRFSDVADVIREAAHLAARRGSSVVAAEDVRSAVEARIYRSNLVEDRIREMIARGTLRIDTSGSAAGQVNGLSVLDLGDYRFGRPDRITASVSIGQSGIIDIEREAKLGGPIHAKGVMILSGYLADRFASDYPLSLTARLVFEQTYGGVEGDSASGAELVALLSRLAEAPIAQGIAMTGSVDQQGRIQAIGGVNEKIEGYYDVCRVLGVTGEQGVVIPAANVDNLMLQDDVISAVEDGMFHVWSVTHVEEAIELLTGLPAGRRLPDGSYPAGSLFRRVDDRLRSMAEVLARFGSPVALEAGDDEEEGASAEAAQPDD